MPLSCDIFPSMFAPYSTGLPSPSGPVSFGRCRSLSRSIAVYSQLKPTILQLSLCLELCSSTIFIYLFSLFSTLFSRYTSIRSLHLRVLLPYGHVHFLCLVARQRCTELTYFL